MLAYHRLLGFENAASSNPNAEKEKWVLNGGLELVALWHIALLCNVLLAKVHFGPLQLSQHDKALSLVFAVLSLGNSEPRNEWRNVVGFHEAWRTFPMAD
jgi:hypothetical protein